MIDIAKLHRQIGSKKNLGNFLTSAAYKQCADSLRTVVPDEEVEKYYPAAKGSPSKRLCHPVLALEYVRWADYPLYMKQAMKMVAKDEHADANSK